MADTTFVNYQTPISADWLNDVNRLTYDLPLTASGKGASLVGVQDAAGLLTATNVEAALQEIAGSLPIINAEAAPYLLTGNPSVDASDTVDAILAAAKALGGATVIWPHGTIKLTREHLIDFSSLSFKGTGRRKVYPGVFVPTTNVPTTFWAAHAGRNAFRIFNSTINVATSLTFEDVNFATIESGSVPTAAIGWDGSGNFHRDFLFNRCGIHGFTSAFDTYNTGGDTAFGLLSVTNCVISRNGYIARNLTGQWNGFNFVRNEAGQQTTGGIQIKAQAATIRCNSLEGQPDTIFINGNYRGLQIDGNYFEANSGSYVIRLQETLNAVVGPNFWQNTTATERLSLVYDVGTKILDRVIPSTLGSFDLQSDERSINPVPLGSATAAFFLDDRFVESISRVGQTEFGGFQVTAPAGPHYSLSESAGLIYTTSGTGLTTATKSALSIASGNYIVVAIPVSYQDDVGLPPRFELKVNSTTTDGYTNPIFYNFDKATTTVKGKTVLYFGVVKATNAVTSFQLLLYPFGLNPAAGLVCYVGAYAMWDFGPTLPSITNVGAHVRAFVCNEHVRRVAAAPLAGTWPVGYRLLARAPAAGGTEGWICTTAGTPGTWKTVGSIAP